jgi:hypothetical protein
MPIEFLNLDPKYVPGAGVRDDSIEALDLVAKYAADTGQFAGAVRAASGAILRCRNMSFDAADKLASMLSYVSVSLEQAAAAAGRVAQGGAAGAAQARADVFRDRRREIVKDIDAEFADEGNKLGLAAQKAMQDLESDIGVATARLTFVELGADEAPEKLIALDRLGVESKNRGVEAVYRTYSALVAAGDDAGCLKMERACERFLLESLAESTAKQVARITHNNTREMRAGDVMAKEHRMAEALLREFDKQRASRVPPDLSLTSMVFTDLLVPTYQRVVGKTLADLPNVQFNAIVAGSGQLPDRLELLERWWSRCLPEARTDSRTISPSVFKLRGGDAGPHGFTLWDGKRRAPANPVGNQVDQPRRAVR